jgi:hypothetical protein
MQISIGLLIKNLLLLADYVTSIYQGLFSPCQEERPWVRGWGNLGTRSAWLGKFGNILRDCNALVIQTPAPQPPGLSRVLTAFSGGNTGF